MQTSKKFLVLSLVGAFAIAASAHADDANWKKKHPRRAQVNKRLNNQQKRVDNGLADGKLSTGQAEKIQNQDASIRAQERRDASQNGGHITQAQQTQLNHEENGVSREINHDEQKNAAQAQAQ
jgi:hypothetical protein